MEAGSIKVEFVAKGNVGRLPEPIEDNLLRMAQEALTNVLKHACATAAWLELDFREAEVVLTIRDNGKGFDISIPSNGNGLRNMKERALEVGANLRFESTIGLGTTLALGLPLT